MNYDARVKGWATRQQGTMEKEEIPLWRSAMELRDCGRYADSLQRLDELLQQDLLASQRALVLLCRIQSLVALNRFAEAKSCLEQALTIADDYLKIQLEFQAAFIAFAEKNYSATAEMIEKLTEKYPAEELRRDADYIEIRTSAL